MLPSAGSRLCDFCTAHRTAAVLLTPNRIVELNDFSGAGKTMCFAIRINIFLFGSYHLCDDFIAETI